MEVTDDNLTFSVAIPSHSFNPFLSRVSKLTRDIDIANLHVPLSVRLSVTFRYQMKTS